MNGRLSILIVSLLLFACQEKKEEAKAPATLPPQYFYYPRANVYFDSANKDYVFLFNDGKTWQTAKQIPNVMQGLMDKSVFIPNPSQPVWKDNDKHKLVYSALLYATPEDTVEKRKPPKLIVKAPVQTSPEKDEEKKVRRGVGRIIDKIFSVFKKQKKKVDTTE